MADLKDDQSINFQVHHKQLKDHPRHQDDEKNEVCQVNPPSLDLKK